MTPILYSAFEWAGTMIKDIADFGRYAIQIDSFGDFWELYLWSPLWIQILLGAVVFGLSIGAYIFIAGWFHDNEPN